MNYSFTVWTFILSLYSEMLPAYDATIASELVVPITFCLSYVAPLQFWECG